MKLAASVATSIIILIVTTAGELKTLTLRDSVTSASCEEGDVQKVIDEAEASAGEIDTVYIKTGSCSWTAQVTLQPQAHDITVRGEEDCTLETMGGIEGIPSACTTIITNDLPAGSTSSLFVITTATGTTARLAHVAFLDGATNLGTGAGLLQVNGQTTGDPLDDRMFRYDHIRFTTTSDPDQFFEPFTGNGLIDHNYFSRTSGTDFMQNVGTTANSFAYPDQRWADPCPRGTTTTVLMESNYIVKTGSLTSGIPVTDSWGGTSYVFRYNYVQNGNINAHGTESGGRLRGSRCGEYYGNTFVGVSNQGQLRSGSWIAFMNDYEDLANNDSVGQFETNRWDSHEGRHFCSADGECIWDLNDAGNPFKVFTIGTITPHANGHEWEITTAGNVTWIEDDYVDMVLKVQGCFSNGGNGSTVPASPMCHGRIRSNNGVTDGIGVLTVDLAAEQANEPHRFTDNDPPLVVEINRVNQLFDNSCAGQGTRISSRTFNYSYTNSLVTATRTNHGLDADDYIHLGSTKGDIEGTYDILADPAPTANNFSFNLHRPNYTGTANNAQSDHVPVIPYDQVVEGCYQWLNTVGVNNTNLPWGGTHNQNHPVRSGTHKFDHDGYPHGHASAGFDGSAAAAQSGHGVGVGTFAQMNTITPTLVNVAFWATDVGEWNTTNGATPDGQLYRWNGSAWVLYYTPSEFPDPRTEPELPPEIISYLKPLLRLLLK
jgi:hypothetical protein